MQERQRARRLEIQTTREPESRRAREHESKGPRELESHGARDLESQGAREPNSQISRDPEIYTWCHSDSVIRLAVPHLKLFLILIMMPLKRCVATENDMTALFKDQA